LDHDNVPGAVSVTEGNSGLTGNGADTIEASNDVFGSTTLQQHVGPSQPGVTNDGSGDRITVDDSQIFQLSVAQYGSGGGTGSHANRAQHIAIGTNSEVEVGLTGKGISAQQPNAGALATIDIESITVYGRSPNGFPPGPPNIWTLQGSGYANSTTVDNVGTTAPGGEFPGNISVYQGNGDNDNVHIAADVIGFTLPVGPVTADFYGVLTVNQGNGHQDVITVDSNGSEGTGPNVFNNVWLTQGNGGGPNDGNSCGPNGYDDQIYFDEATVTSNLFIYQNAVANLSVVNSSGFYSFNEVGVTDGTGQGNNLVTIGANEQVLVFGRTRVYQGGANNEVDLGGAMDASGIDFETTYLDIFTGKGGGGFVMAQNTVVDVGSFNPLLSFVIDGGGTGNTFADLGGNVNVTISGNYSG
jgi:hypothetical protein